MNPAKRSVIHPSVERFRNRLLVDLEFARADTLANSRGLQSEFYNREDKTQDLQEFLCEKVIERVTRQPV